MGMEFRRRDLWELVRSIPVCMLTTRDGDMLRSRPMATVIDEDKQEFLFLRLAPLHIRRVRLRKAPMSTCRSLSPIGIFSSPFLERAG